MAGDVRGSVSAALAAAPMSGASPSESYRRSLLGSWSADKQQVRRREGRPRAPVVWYVPRRRSSPAAASAGRDPCREPPVHAPTGAPRRHVAAPRMPGGFVGTSGKGPPWRGQGARGAGPVKPAEKPLLTASDHPDAGGTLILGFGRQPIPQPPVPPAGVSGLRPR